MQTLMYKVAFFASKEQTLNYYIAMYIAVFIFLHISSVTHVTVDLFHINLL